MCSRGSVVSRMGEEGRCVQAVEGEGNNKLLEPPFCDYSGGRSGGQLLVKPRTGGKSG